MPHAIAVSPHLDDAAFSCGGILAGLAAAGWSVTIVTAFTLSVPDPKGFALACQLDKGLPAKVDYMAIRRAEDAEACRRLGAHAIWLPFPEAPHRGYDHAHALFGPVNANDDMVASLALALADLLSSPSDLVLGPQAVGGHVDHVQVVHALRLVLPKNMPVWWWTDFPYAARSHSHPSRPFENSMAVLPERSIIVNPDARITACAAYATQIGFQFGGLQGLEHAMAAAGDRERVRESGRRMNSIPDNIL